MPKRRRPTQSSQGNPRRRRPIRRPEFAPEPEAPTDLDGNPIFADEGLIPSATAHYGSAGPVETRPHWIQQQERVQGRRMSQLRRGSRDEAPAGRAGASGQLPVLERSYIMGEIKRVSVLTGSLLALLIALTIVLR